MLVIQETGAPGWAEVVFDDDLPQRILIKIAARDGRWAVVRLLIDGELIDATTPRAIPIARIESMLNTPGIGEGIAGPQMAEKHPSPWLRSFGEEFQQVDDALGAYFAETSRMSLGPDARTARTPLERPDGTDPEGFYRKVAEVYNDAVQETGAPAKLMAEEAGVPTVTVHRWISEARRRGFLPPARKGRAG